MIIIMGVGRKRVSRIIKKNEIEVLGDGRQIVGKKIKPSA